MCGIIGYCGHRPAVPLIVEGLKRLEYRGYDSAGIGFLQSGEVEVVKAKGKLAALEDKLAEENIFNATFGLGHTRWATHGVPNEANAHPHTDMDKTLAIIHNGIIENYQALKDGLTEKGYTFYSDTDTEVLANLISLGIREKDDLLQGVAWAVNQADGAYAIGVIHKDYPGQIVAARKSSPLVFGTGVGENFIASDIPAFLKYTRDVVFLDDGELVRMDDSSWEVYKAADLSRVDKEVNRINWDVQAAERGGFKHFMTKEIFEQPKVITDCMAGRADFKNMCVNFSELENEKVPDKLTIVACGTSYHAGLWGKYLIEAWARIPVNVEIASEFRYRDLILDSSDRVLAISQSGETLDTLAGIRIAKEHGAGVIGLCNVVGSSVARESDVVVYTQAGPEISVASTKAMCSQLTAMLLLALYWGGKNGNLDLEIRDKVLAELMDLPDRLDEVLPEIRKRAHKLSREYSEATSFLYLGRGLNYPLAMEGALKLKEISYIHAEGYAAGEMKHGPIALIDPKFPTFAIALDDALFPKVKSNLEEVQAREGKIIALTQPGAPIAVDDSWRIPEAWGPLSSFFVLPALQLFAYEMADYLGKDVDQPRNLAKSVTVE